MPRHSPFSFSQRAFEIELYNRRAAGYFVAAGAAIGGAALHWLHSLVLPVGSWVQCGQCRSFAIVFAIVGVLNLLAGVCVRSQR